jgi:hypothetical protein
MHVRYLDTNRYEHHTNTFTIAKFGWLAPGSRPGKGTRNSGNHSALWFYEIFPFFRLHRVWKGRRGIRHYANMSRFPGSERSNGNYARSVELFADGKPVESPLVRYNRGILGRFVEFWEKARAA